MIEDDKVKLVFRFNRALHDRLKAAAERSVRSLNGEIRYRLESSFTPSESDESAAA